MTTPTCNTCGTKFPGKERCKKCGANPTGKTEVEAKVAMLKKTLPKTMPPAVRVLDEAMAQVSTQMRKAGIAIAEAFKDVDWDEMRKYERRMVRAKSRSIRTTHGKTKHGAHRG